MNPHKKSPVKSPLHPGLFYNWNAKPNPFNALFLGIVVLGYVPLVGLGSGLIAGEFHLPLQTGDFIGKSPACSPTMNSTLSNPCWPAHELPSVRRALNLKARSILATSYNCGQAPTRTGRRVCS